LLALGVLNVTQGQSPSICISFGIALSIGLSLL
jgi:hypothetical protein